MNIVVVQTNPIAGNLRENLEDIKARYEEAKKAGAELVIFSGEALCGYPYGSLATNKEFSKAAISKISEFASNCELPVLLSCLGNILFLNEGHCSFVKDSFCFKDKIFAVRFNDKFYQVECLADTTIEADYNIILSAIPYVYDEFISLNNILSDFAKGNNLTTIFANQVGCNEGKINVGQSRIYSRKGELISQAKSFESDIISIEEPKLVKNFESQEEAWFDSLVFGVRDFMKKINSKRIVLGLSGGMDSALVATIAKEAVGAENVLAVLMPSPYTSQLSYDDAYELANNLDIRAELISIKDLMLKYEDSLSPIFKDMPKDLTEENIQSRIRGVLLMAIANKHGYLLLNTGNKSELSVGYCTLYGDTCGALSPIADLYKTQVFDLARFINKQKAKELIPISIITKAPTAELRENQKDEDSLPSYEVLDAILKHIIEGKELEFMHNQSEVDRVKKLFSGAEFKRRQVPPLLKLSSYDLGEYKIPMTAVL